METETPKRSSQFRILDLFLLASACAFACAVLVPAAAREPNGKIIAVGAAAVMTLVGSAVSYPVWRFLMRRRFTVLAVNHVGYFLLLLVLAIVWDDEVLRLIPILVGGPLSFFGYTSWLLNAFPFVSRSWVAIFIIVFLALPMVLLMCAHVARPNLIGVVLTSLGTALWYLAAFGAGLARMY
jgi:hypothetical protein